MYNLFTQTEKRLISWNVKLKKVVWKTPRGTGDVMKRDFGFETRSISVS